jgi:hypothetical protein
MQAASNRADVDPTSTVCAARLLDLVLGGHDWLAFQLPNYVRG